MSQSTKVCTVLLAVACVLLIAGVPAFGQAVNGTLLGTLTDSSGAVVPNATVTATEVSTGVVRTTQSNTSGNYVFPDLPPGTYRVLAEAQGFKKEARSDLRVEVNSTVRADLTMQPGAVTEVLEVTATAPVLQTDRADVAQKIEETQLKELPVGGANRNFQGLLALVPGTVRPHRDHSEFFNAQDTLSTEVNGQSREYNQLAIEGVNDDERTGLLQIYVPPAEAIQTVDVSTSNYTAEFGRAGGAVTNVILKSGTNQFHGSLYEYNRISALAARSFFNRAPNPVAPTTYNYYGGTIGGPIIKDKTFFFFDLLRISDVRGQFNQQTVPTDAFRNGDFRGQQPIYDPTTGNPNGTGRAQFSCNGVLNVVCPNRISPIAQRILALIPHANRPGITNNYVQNTQLRKTPNSFDVKIDHNFRPIDRLAFRFSRAVQNVYQQPIFGLAGGPANGSFQGTGIQHEQSGAINETHIFAPTLVMETRAGISHYRNIARSADYGSKASDALGIPGVNLDNFTSGLVGIRILSINGDNPLIGYSASLPWDRGETNINIVNIWTKLHGNHAFKWGADIRRLRDDLVQAQTFSPRGRITFSTGTTSLNSGSGSSQTSLANNFAALLIDAPTEVGRDVSIISGSWRETEAFFFGQDTWHATNRLTIDAGLRWEYYEPAVPAHSGGYSNYDPARNVLVIAGVGGNPSNLGRETYYKYFAPRFGLAYRLGEQTVFRGGFGISYEPFANNQYAFNFPIRQNQVSKQANVFALPQFPNGTTATMAAGFPAPTPVAVSPNGIITINPNNPNDQQRLSETYNVIDKHFQQPYVESWNVTVQRSLPRNFVLDVAYVGNHGVKIPMNYNLNAATAPSLNPNGSIQNNNCVQGNSTRPLCNAFGRSGDTNFLFRRSTSNYNSLQVRFDHRWKNGFLLTTAYTYSKALAYRADMGSDEGAPHFYLDWRRNYSVESRSRTHTFVQSYVYELPFGKNKPYLQSGWASWLVGGWGVSGVLTRMTGTPLRFTANGNSLAANNTEQKPIQIAPYRILGGVGAGHFYFDTSAFCPVGVSPLPAGCPAVGNGVLGNVAHYAFSGPGVFNLDAAVFRNFPIRERMGLELRAEAFSITNTPHFSNPNVDRSSSQFGQITGTGDQNGGVGDGNRVLELSARFSF